ncbi:sigma-70 family RNA polymerase sigma factor [Nocardioides pantholopis]|uniref:sigma-70 family RNA polymerase sigma factor n=1 Tax=Nocardioides pantholopis TaxID=2483798 RepID=UPI000FD9A9DB|nr:sigma-70 family RNA polymerase sigma factor [Nocardioides pantholopis]
MTAVQTARTPQNERALGRAERSTRTAALLREVVGCSDEVRRRELLDEVIVLNRGVAESVASRYRNRGVSLDDLHQVAYLGLTRAVFRYDADRAEDLLTYAVPTIRGEIQRHFRDHGWAIRPTRRVQELQGRVNHAIERLAQELGRDPTHDEVRADLGVSREDYDQATGAFGCFQPISLDRPATTSSPTSIGELLGEDQSVGAAEARTVLRPVLRNLSERDRRILYLRFFEDRTQEEIGRDLGVTQMQVSRLLKRILLELRGQIDEPVG